MTKVKEATLYKGKDNKYYINVTYIYENNQVITEINVPKIEIPLLAGDHLVIRQDTICGHPYHYLQLPEDILEIHPVNGVHYIEHIIEEKVQEMTIDEIESKLGYKVKIINNKK